MKLDAPQITAAALELLQAEGLDGLSMRPLATKLGVRASALYWHVTDKDQLYALMAAHFYAAAYAQADRAESARAWLEALGRHFRRVLLAHRDSARLCAIAPPDAPRSPAVTGRITARLVAFGMAEPEALADVASVLALTLGWVVYEQSRSMHEHLAGMMDLDATYGAGLVALIDGLLPASDRRAWSD